jgi:glycosyltransferase involved in cell wall biosynthesis
MEEVTPLVSICMPAYNAGKYISEAVNSVLEQSYKNLELVIVNDGSTDDTAEQLKKITDSRVTVYEQENRGQSAAANVAYSKSSGSLIKFMDADDIISQMFIEKQVKRIGTRDDVIVSAAWGRFYNDDINTFKLSPETVWRDMTPQQWLIASWENANAMMQCALWLIPRKILDLSGLWDENISLINDLDFFTRVLLSSKQVLFEEDAVLYYRSGLYNSLSGTKDRKAILSAFTSMDNAINNLLRTGKSAQAMKACANVWQHFIYDTYPQHPDLVAAVEKRVAELGGSSLKFKCGGFTKILVAPFGWKAAKRIKNMLK